MVFIYLFSYGLITDDINSSILQSAVLWDIQWITEKKENGKLHGLIHVISLNSPGGIEKKTKKISFLFYFLLHAETRKGTVLGQPARHGVSVNCSGDGGGINCGSNAKSETETSQNL